MSTNDLIERYNYDEFVPEKFMPWMRIDQSPSTGEKATDFPLWHLDESETSLSAILSQNPLTVVEFGSYT